MVKKSVFKRVFGKSKSKQNQSAKDATSMSSVGGGTGRVNSNPTPVESAAANPTPPAPQRQAGENYERSDGKNGEEARLTPGSTESVAAHFGEKNKVEGDALLSENATRQENSRNEQKKEGESVKLAADQTNDVGREKANEVEREKVDNAESDGMAIGEENEAEGLEIKVQESEKAKQENRLGKRNKQAWAEEKLLQLHSPSSSKLLEKPKIEVGHENNAERRKWIEGLSSPKKEPATSNLPDELKNVGALSDRMMAVEQALHEKGKCSSPSHSVSREKAAAQRKAIEEMLRSKKDPKAFLDSKESARYSLSPGTQRRASQTREKAAAQRRAIEEMLRSKKDPKAFLDSKESARDSLSPGTQRLASQRQWVLETLEKQNDPKTFLDQNKESRRKMDTSNEQRDAFEERKKNLEEKAIEAKQVVEC